MVDGDGLAGWMSMCGSADCLRPAPHETQPGSILTQRLALRPEDTTHLLADWFCAWPANGERELVQSNDVDRVFAFCKMSPTGGNDRA